MEEKRLNDEIVDAIRRVLIETVPLRIVVHNDHDQLLGKIKSLLDAQTGTVRCRFSAGEANGITHFLTAKGERKETLKDLRLWVKNAKHLIIADPYFMQGDPTGWDWKNLPDRDRKSKAHEYATEVAGILGDVSEVDIFHLPSPPKELRTAMKKVAFRGRNFTTYETTDIHDRVWIKDRDEARIIGTSFGGIGNKLSFMIALPDDDLNAFQGEIAKMKKRLAPFMTSRR